MPEHLGLQFNKFLSGKALEDPGILKRGSLHGLERECLRVDHAGQLSHKPHPESLGAPLTHPYITTDFCEAQIEFTTQPHASIEDVLGELSHLQRFVCNRLQKEWLWPFSMPARLPVSEKDIPLAQFGHSREGLKKTIYRRGLGHRYGRRMQTISGIHYNFSIGSELLKLLQSDFSNPTIQKYSAIQFRSSIYLHIIRNLRRRSLLIPFLFGASPYIHESFLNKDTSFDPRLKKDHKAGLYAPDATSLRLSRIGYTNQLQRTLPIGYNKLADYISGMRYALQNKHTAYSHWSDLKDQQLNDSILQIENEHYAIIRPKPIFDPATSAIDALENQGIAYLEIRGLDLNPFVDIGVDKQRIYFMHMLLLDCLFEPSPPETKQEIEHRRLDFDRIVWEGRREKFCLQDSGEFMESAGRLYLRLENLAELLDRSEIDKPYQKSLLLMKSFCQDLEATPSAQTLRYIQEHDGFLAAGLKLAARHCASLEDHSIPPSILKHIQQATMESVQAREALEQKELSGTLK